MESPDEALSAVYEHDGVRVVLPTEDHASNALTAREALWAGAGMVLFGLLVPPLQELLAGWIRASGLDPGLEHQLVYLVFLLPRDTAPYLAAGLLVPVVLAGLYGTTVVRRAELRIQRDGLQIRWVGGLTWTRELRWDQIRSVERVGRALRIVSTQRSFEVWVGEVPEASADWLLDLLRETHQGARTGGAADSRLIELLRDSRE